MKASIVKRIEALEARKADSRLIVCSCATRNNYQTPIAHFADCPALAATDDDTVIIIRYADDVIA